MMLVLRLPFVFITLSFPVTLSGSICEKRPAMSMMLNMLRPTSRILVDCAPNVITTHRLNSSFLTKIVDVICQYHDECKEETWGTEDMQIYARRSIASECYLRKFLNLYPAFKSVRGSEGTSAFMELMGCFSMESGVEFGDANVTSAIMHWLYEVLRSGA